LVGGVETETALTTQKTTLRQYFNCKNVLSFSFLSFRRISSFLYKKGGETETFLFDRESEEGKGLKVSKEAPCFFASRTVNQLYNLTA
jgi:hypothetical protein